MWILDKKEQKAIEKVKASRPSCIKPSIIHTFIEYWGDNKKTCHDCNYTEKLVIKE